MSSSSVASQCSQLVKSQMLRTPYSGLRDLYLPTSSAPNIPLLRTQSTPLFLALMLHFLDWEFPSCFATLSLGITSTRKHFHNPSSVNPKALMWVPFVHHSEKSRKGPCLVEIIFYLRETNNKRRNYMPALHHRRRYMQERYK